MVPTALAIWARAPIQYQEVVPAGSTQTGGLGGYTVVATSGSNSTGNNFDNFTNISISGTKFNDITGNSFSGDDVGWAA